MIVETTKYFCDRCRKEIDKPYYDSVIHVSIHRFRRKHLITRWNADYGLFEPTHLCEYCAKGFNEWWKKGSKL